MADQSEHERAVHPVEPAPLDERELEISGGIGDLGAESGTARANPRGAHVRSRRARARACGWAEGARPAAQTGRVSTPRFYERHREVVARTNQSG